jgi:S-(hydroxymethyl)glutathione dehydrogenase/alcohol dehydrogenase
MKAAVCYAFGQPLTIDDIEIDPPQAGEVKVQIAACAICQSDLHWIRGGWGGATPLVAGHEAAGVVKQVGDGVSLVQPGDPVVVYLRRSCGRCYYCTIGRPYNCEGRFALDRESRLRTRSGQVIVQGLRTAAFAEYAVVDQSQVVKVPADLPLDRACLLACGVATGVGAVVNTAQVEPGSAVVVIGAGGVGLNSVQGAALSGAVRIIAMDVLDNKLEAARSFGATHVVNSRREDAIASVLALTGGRGADYAFVTVGSSAAMAQATQMTRKGGTTVIVGMPANEDARLTLDVFQLTEGRAVIGSLMGSTRLAVDIPRLVELYQQRRLKLDELITGRYPLERINEALESMERGEAVRNVVAF